MGYRRNTAVRSLARRKSETIGVVCSDMSHYGPANTLLGVQQAARENGYFVSMASVEEVTSTSIGDAASETLRLLASWRATLSATIRLSEGHLGKES